MSILQELEGRYKAYGLRFTYDNFFGSPICSASGYIENHAIYFHHRRGSHTYIDIGFPSKDSDPDMPVEIVKQAYLKLEDDGKYGDELSDDEIRQVFSILLESLYPQPNSVGGNNE